MFKPFDVLTYNKLEVLDGENNWTWINEDVGLWGAPNDGPHNEWPHFKKVYQDYTRNKHTVVQAGGACGMYPRLLANMFSHVYTFEPDYLNFHCLVNNCQSPNIIKINAALGDDHRMIQMNLNNRWNSGMHQVNKGVPGFIPQLRIDDFEFESLDLIALDVEAYEFNVIKGAENNIRKHTPLISAERANDDILPFLQSLHEKYVCIGQLFSDSFYFCNKDA